MVDNKDKINQDNTRLTRHELGEAWMWCFDCNAKLYSFDGDKDKGITCPTKQQCKEDNQKYS
jgi:hypothetical protein